MHNKKTLDEWLSWQEQLMEETILLGLDRVQLVYQRLFPDGVAFLAITVGGTNGKGSTIAFIDSIIESQNIEWVVLLHHTSLSTTSASLSMGRLLMIQ